MGSVVSSLRTVRIAVAALLKEKALLDALMARVKSSPGIPITNPSTPFWTQPPHKDLVDLDPRLPRSVDVVIIGSGITATSLARTLLAGKPDLRLVIIEARGVCEGATGRNGGHIKESPFENYRMLRKKFGPKIAAKICKFRLDHVEELVAAAAAEGASEEGQVRVVEGCDVFFDEGARAKGKEGFDLWKKEMPEEARDFIWWDADETRKRTGLPTALGCVAGPAGALWPYRLCTAIQSRLIKDHKSFSLIQHTPVMSVKYSDAEGVYLIDTPKGMVKAPTLVHATNGHAAHYLPGLRGKLFPIRAQMSAQSPPKTAPANPDGKRSWIMIYAGGYDYLTQLPSGEMMLGGGFAPLGAKKAMERFGNADDSGIDIFTASHLGAILPYLFSGGDQQADSWEGVDVKKMWTGTLGFSADLLPWVGKVPLSISKRGQPKQKMGKGGVLTGEFVCAGYSGEGMVNAYGCAHFLGRMLLGEDADDKPVKPKLPEGKEGMGRWEDRPIITWFPKEMVITEDRVKKADIMDLFELLDD